MVRRSRWRHVERWTQQSDIGKHIARSQGHQERHGMHAYLPTPMASISLAGNDRIACIAGSHVLLLDPKTGQEAESPFDLGVRAGRVPQWVDVDTDGSSELIFLEELPTTIYPHIPTAKLHVWSVVQRQSLWSMKLEADWPRQPSWTVEAPHGRLWLTYKPMASKKSWCLISAHRNLASRVTCPATRCHGAKSYCLKAAQDASFGVAA